MFIIVSFLIFNHTSYAKYVSNSIWDYYLNSNKFYFESDYLAMNLHDRDIIRATRKEALAEGALQKAIETAKNLWTNGVSLEIIAKSLNMTTEQVNEIVTKAAVCHPKQ